MVSVGSKSIASLILKGPLSLLINGGSFSRLAISQIQSREGQKVKDQVMDWGTKEKEDLKILKARVFIRETPNLPPSYTLKDDVITKITPSLN